MAETKPKQTPSLRTPRPKKLGLAVPPALRLPHEELIVAEAAAAPSEAMTTMTSQTSHSSLTSHSSHSPAPESSTPAEVPVSPVRDYTKVANSIPRQAVPAGLFKGKSKQLYDQLYALTRGAVVPKRKVRISRPKLMKLAHIGARATFDGNIEHLRAVGLIAVTVVAGEHEGNEYEVFIPEELSMPSQTSQGSHTSQTSHAQKVDRLVGLESSQTRHSTSVENTDTYAEPKTFIKTNTKNDDDEAFAPLLRAMRGEMGRRVERAPLAELAEMLAAEFKIAEGRTEGVSNAAAFFLEHMRRRLWKKDRRQVEEEGKSGAGSQEPATKVDASKCPDCFGTGMWYPEGFDKGVARCRHQKLTLDEPKQNE